MIKINVENKNDVITSIKITGHAGYADKGNDIVCASVSSIAITTVNALLRIDNDCISYEETDGKLVVDINSHDRVVDILVQNMIELFEQLANDYKENIKINK